MALGILARGCQLVQLIKFIFIGPSKLILNSTNTKNERYAKNKKNLRKGNKLSHYVTQNLLSLLMKKIKSILAYE